MTASTGVDVSCRGLVYIYRLEGYDVVALAGVDLDIIAGESVALLGPSGSGKSTLLAVIAGLLKPSAGRLVVGNHDVAKAGAAELAGMRAESVGVVLQGAWRNLLPYLTVEQNVRFAQRGAGGRRRNLPAPREVLGLVGLSGRNRLRMRPHQLTPGERQRLALAVALSNRPGLLLADEPTSQLDSRARDEVVAALDSVRDSGATVVVVTHDPAVGARMGRTVTIRDGRVGAEGRRGQDYAVVRRDGSIHLPPEALGVFAPGMLVDVVLEPDGTARLVPIGAVAVDGYPQTDPVGPAVGGSLAAYAAGPFAAEPALASPVREGPSGPAREGPSGRTLPSQISAGLAGPAGPAGTIPAAASSVPPDTPPAPGTRPSGLNLAGHDVIGFDYWGSEEDQ